MVLLFEHGANKCILWCSCTFRILLELITPCLCGMDIGRAEVEMVTGLHLQREMKNA